MTELNGILETVVQEKNGGPEWRSFLSAAGRCERIAGTVLACQPGVSAAEAVRRAMELMDHLDSSFIPQPSTLTSTPAAVPSPGTPGGQAQTDPAVGAPTFADATLRASGTADATLRASGTAGVDASRASAAAAGACQQPNAVPAGGKLPTAGAATWEPTDAQISAYFERRYTGLHYPNRDRDAQDLIAARAVLRSVLAADHVADVSKMVPDQAGVVAEYERQFDRMLAELKLLKAGPGLDTATWDRVQRTVAHADAAREKRMDAPLAPDGRASILAELQELAGRVEAKLQ